MNGAEHRGDVEILGGELLRQERGAGAWMSIGDALALLRDGSAECVYVSGRHAHDAFVPGLGQASFGHELALIGVRVRCDGPDALNEHRPRLAREVARERLRLVEGPMIWRRAAERGYEVCLPAEVAGLRQRCLRRRDRR